jgi:hypothetical protein
MVLKVLTAIRQARLVRGEKALSEPRIVFTNLRPHVAVACHPGAFHRVLMVLPKQEDADYGTHDEPPSTVALGISRRWAHRTPSY